MTGEPLAADSHWSVLESADLGRLAGFHAADPARGPSPRYKVVEEWRGAKAQAIIDVCNRPKDYPYWNTYLMWPGPNSNTYVAWVLKQARASVDYHPMCMGKDYMFGLDWDHVGLYGVGFGLTSTWTGFQVEAHVVGLKVGLLEGVEIHFLQTTTGIDFWPPAIKTPWGRFGFGQ